MLALVDHRLDRAGDLRARRRRLVLAVGGLVIAALLLGRPGRLPSTAVDFVTWSSVVAAALSFGAAAIHFAVIGEHFAEYPPYGVAFTAFAWFQVGWAVLYLRRRTRGLAVLAIVVNLGALIVWAVSRIAGLPIGAWRAAARTPIAHH